MVPAPVVTCAHARIKILAVLVGTFTGSEVMSVFSLVVVMVTLELETLTCASFTSPIETPFRNIRNPLLFDPLFDLIVPVAEVVADLYVSGFGAEPKAGH